MFIKIDKEFVKTVRLDIKNNPNKEIGYIYKPDNTYIKIKGKKLSVDFPKGDLMGIEMHTHPLKSSIGYKNSPPSERDYFTSYFHYKLNDAVVFDKSGLWIYKPNKNLVNIHHKNINSYLFQIIDSGLKEHYSNLDFDKDYTIENYIKNLKTLAYRRDTKILYGFNVKYYSYVEFNKLGSIKLRYYPQYVIDDFSKSILK